MVSAVAFNNCSGGFTAIDPVDQIEASSQCRTKIINSSKAIVTAMDPAVCEKAENYQCDLRHFRKGVGSDHQENHQCADIAGMGETCVAVSVYNYDTTAQQLVADASQLIEGGSYNRDEVSCINTKVVSHQIALVQAEGNDLATALEKTIEGCRQRSRQ